MKKDKDKFFELIIGDVSGDGHNSRDSYFVKTALEANIIKKCYEHGAHLLDVDIDELTSEYESNHIGNDKINALVNAGFSLDNIDYDENSGCRLWIDDYYEIYSFIVDFGAKKLGVIDEDDVMFELMLTDKIDIGGYGLYT